MSLEPIGPPPPPLLGTKRVAYQQNACVVRVLTLRSKPARRKRFADMLVPFMWVWACPTPGRILLVLLRSELDSALIRNLRKQHCWWNAFNRVAFIGKQLEKAFTTVVVRFIGQCGKAMPDVASTRVKARRTRRFLLRKEDFGRWGRQTAILERDSNFPLSALLLRNVFPNHFRTVRRTMARGRIREARYSAAKRIVKRSVQFFLFSYWIIAFEIKANSTSYSSKTLFLKKTVWMFNEPVHW